MTCALAHVLCLFFSVFFGLNRHARKTKRKKAMDELNWQLRTEILKLFENQYLAARAIGITPAALSLLVRKRRPPNAGEIILLPAST